MRLILKRRVIGIRRDSNPQVETTHANAGDRVKVIFNNTTGSVHDTDNLIGHFVCEHPEKWNEFVVFPSQVDRVIIERESEIEETDISINSDEQVDKFLMNNDSLYPE